MRVFAQKLILNTKKTDLKNKEFKAVFLIKDETSLLTNEKKCFIV